MDCEVEMLKIEGTQSILHPKIVREVEGGEKMFDSEARSGA